MGTAGNTSPWCNLLLSVCRMEAEATIDEIKKRNIQETVQYREELEKLKYIPIKETKLKNFMVSKLTDRSGLEEKAKKEKGNR